MDINSMPVEILDRIFSNLRPAEEVELRNTKDLRSVRLVSQKWNAVASRHLFHTMWSKHDHNEQENIFTPWHNLIDLEAVRESTRCVVIDSELDNLQIDGIPEGWFQWRQGEYPGFTNAVARIKELPKLKTARIRFLYEDMGLLQFPDSYSSSLAGQWEKMSIRLYTLETVFRAIKERMIENPNFSKITSLTLENPRHVYLPELSTSLHFHEIAKNITEFHLVVRKEFRDGMFLDRDINPVEFERFYGHRPQSWLRPLADQLTTLSLSGIEPWGCLPGHYHFDGLKFPNLRSLLLGHFAIAHRNQMNWVLAQKSLTSLRLEHCFIVSHIALSTSSEGQWNVHTDSWVPEQAWEYGFGNGHNVYQYLGTWQDEFDRIRQSLPNLINFQFHHAKYEPRRHFHRVLYQIPEEAYKISPLRYVVCNSSVLGTEWYKNRDGFLHFRGYDPVANRLMQEAGLAVKSPKRAEETEKDDSRALIELLATVKKRHRTPAKTDM